MIYYFTPALDRPSGGVRVMYRHVDVLNKCGLPAAIVHPRRGFRCTWFENHTRVDSTPIDVGPDDVLVFPEQYPAEVLNGLAPGVRKVVLNQNAYRTFEAGRLAGRSPAFDCPDVVAAIVVSTDNQEYVEYAFPQLPVYRVRQWIDGSVFFPEVATQGRRITAMPHKRPQDFHQVRSLLERRGALRDWELVALRGRSEGSVAQELRRSPLFLNFPHAEGFGMPGAEALASGCFVIGFHGQAGREFLVPPHAASVEDGDVVALATAVEAFLADYERHRTELQGRMTQASNWVRDLYSYENQADDLVTVFGALAPGSNATTHRRIDGAALRLEPRVRTATRRFAHRVGRALGV